MTDLPEQRLSLGEAAYRRLRADIVACRLAPGQRVTEKQLAADTGFGISPLRDALTRLDHEGLIRTLPRKGYQVTPLTPKSIDDLFALWEIVGPEIVRLAIRVASDEQLARARACFDPVDPSLGDNPDIDQVVTEVEAAAAAFGILAEATGNRYLKDLHERLFGEMGRVWALVLASEPGAMVADPPDYWIVDALDARDADKAATMARRHIQKMRQRVLESVVRWPSVMASAVLVPLGR